MTELYTMQRYLRPDLLKNAGLENFDDWASTFGEVVSQLEMKPAGDGYRMKNRFSKFVNIPELMQMYKEFADIQTADILKLPVPKLKTGEPIVVSAKPNDLQKAYMQELARRSEAIHGGNIDPSEDNMLILNLANTIITNTKGEGDKSGEDFWVKAERLLYCSFIALIYFEFPTEEKNFESLLWLINQSETREDDETFKNRIDLTFEKLEERKGSDHFAVRQYKKYKLAAGKTAKSILISCGARLAPFDIDKVRKMMAYDEMELDKLGEEKTALFVIVSDTSTTFNFIIAMLYTQLFNLLCTVADDKYGGRLPIHVRCLLDEFANSVTRSALKRCGA